MKKFTLKISRLSIASYLTIIFVLAMVPALINSYHALNQTRDTLRSAQAEQTRLAKIELLNIVQKQTQFLIDSANRIAHWNDTKALLSDATYYSYWKQSRIRELLGKQLDNIINITLYDANGKPISADDEQVYNIDLKRVSSPVVTKRGQTIVLLYFHPIKLRKQSAKRQGYIGITMDLDKKLTAHFIEASSKIKTVNWSLSDTELVPLTQALNAAQLEVKHSNEMQSLVKIIKQGYINYFIYTLLLLATIAVLLLFFVARPLRKLTSFLRDTDSNKSGIIPDDIYGGVKVNEFENVRDALNEYKNRFLHAASHLEKTNKELLHLTFNDPLTHCANRRSFERRLKYILTNIQNTDQQHALLYIDVDQFKVVNDTCGHSAGDELLRQIAALLNSKIRDTDLLARLGGDEFGIILSNCDPQFALELAETIRLNIKNNRFSWQQQAFDISVSIGLVPINRDNSSLSEIMRNADTACYTAKDTGRNRVHCYEPNDEEVAFRHSEMQWLNKITHALDSDQFTLYGQQIFRLDKPGAPAHYEVLLRYLDGNGQSILPMAFIPAAEQYGVIKNIDKWVIDKALSLLGKALAQHPNEKLYISINLSGHSIGDQEILAWIKTQLQVYNIPPTLIWFEITETAAIANFRKAIDFIQQLRALGCKFALDDFGSGLSSFSYLSNLEIDAIKIDGHFIKTIKDNHVSRIIINAINQIGNILDLMVVAEFAEDEAIIGELKKLNIQSVQGFGIHQPEPLQNLLMPASAQNQRI